MRLARMLVLVLLALACTNAALAANFLGGGSQHLLAVDRIKGLELRAVAADGALTVAGLRVQGHLQALLLAADASTAQAAASNTPGPNGQQLDFDQIFDRLTDSWTVRVALPAQAAPARVELWCRACQDGSAGLLASQSLDVDLVQEGQQAGSVVVVLLVADGQPALATPARRLQQVAAPCTLTVAGTAHTFASCGSLLQTTSRYSLQVYSTVESAPSGTGAVLKVGIAAKTNGGWASWALPRRKGVMLGASAVVVWPTATGAEVAGFLLPSNTYDEGAINAAKGTFAISDAAAENASGELRAVFSITLPSYTADAIAAAPVNYIYAVGPMTASQQPGLSDHTLGGYPYGSGSMQVKQATAAATTTTVPTTTTTTTEPAITTAPVASAVPATEASGGDGNDDDDDDNEREEEGEREEGSRDDDDDDDDDDDGGSSAGSTTTGTATADGAASAAAAATGASACSLQLSSGGAAQPFSGCRLINRIGSNFYLLWKTEPSAANPSKTKLTFGLNATTSNGYVSVGFPSRPGRMSGATAMILQTCASGSSGCTNGAKLLQYYMSGTSQSSVNLDNRLAITNIQAGLLPGGQLVGSFQMEVDTPASTAGRRRLLLLQNSDGSMPLIFAAGPVSTTGIPRQHNNEGSGTVAVFSPTPAGTGGSTASGGEVDSEEENSSLKAAHAWLAAIGWGVLVPLGIVVARSFKELDPHWFHLHRVLQTLGFILGTVALGLGFELAGGWDTDESDLTVHRNLGVACTALGACQFTAIVVRPKKGSKYRFAWELWHHWVGRSAAVIAIANIYYGLLHIWELGVWTWASYTAVLAVIVGVSVVKDTSDWLRNRKAAAPGSAADANGAVQLTRPPSKTPPHSPDRAHDVESNGAPVV